MNWLLDLSTRGKLHFGFGLMLAFLSIVIATAYLGIGSIQATQKTLYTEDYANLRDMATLRTQFNQLRALLLEAQLPGSPGARDAILDQADQGSKHIDQLLRQLNARARTRPELLPRLNELRSVWEAFAQTKDRETIPLIRAGNLATSQRLAIDVQQARVAQIREMDERLVGELEERMRLAVARSEDQAAYAMQVFALAGAAALGAGLLLAALLTRVIAAPLREITARAGRIAAGELTTNAAPQARRDEIGQLEQGFNAMAATLGERAGLAREIAEGNLGLRVEVRSTGDVLGNALATMVISLRGMTREIDDGVNVLTSSASEIAATATQVAAGSAETATALSQTTATVEEVKQTAKVAADKARHVSESAQKTVDTARDGSQSVEESIEAMQHIQEQMAALASCIVQLSEQSQAIGEIISTVGDLAEQSNLLAVNAAIEAAKAGDHGKGFAVVAQEVKSLAEQSKQATRQVRTLLGDIQKAASSAVLATERGSRAVDTGVKLSHAMGGSIRELAANIDEAARAATHIAVSAQQQLAGMDQVALAMQNIHAASEQNVASTRQTETAAKDLHELGIRLRELTGRYRLDLNEQKS